MIYNGIDLRGWNPRTLETVRKHGGLDKSRYEGWLRNACGGDHQRVEFEYLRHTGNRVFVSGHHHIEYEPSTAIEAYSEAKKIFELLYTLKPDYPLAKRNLAKCDEAIREVQSIQ